MMDARVDAEVRAALAAIETEDASPGEKVEMLMEIAMGLQQRPKSADHLQQAIGLYEKALELCPPEQQLLGARVLARLGTALQAAPAEDADNLLRARQAFEQARDVLGASGSPEELAELEMNLGLALQSLVGMNKAGVTEAISAYQRSLRTFDAARFPREFAILQNNLATLFLSIPFSDQRAKMREALAVQSFEEGLKIVNIIDHPSEYAMLQNNLGNALQYASSSHAFENNLRALDAYDEALKVRTRRDTPMEYANTICNRANCLLNLPDDAEHPEHGNPGHAVEALASYREALAIFQCAGATEKSRAIREIIAGLASETGANGAPRGNGAVAPVMQH